MSHLLDKTTTLLFIKLHYLNLVVCDKGDATKNATHLFKDSFV